MDRYENYESPLVTRNASAAMCRLFGSRKRIRTWRQLWVALADAQRRQGLAITKRQVDALRRAIDDIDFRAAAAYERKMRHDVMAHVHTFGDRAPKSRGILHLGATSAYITDNADLIIMRDALHLIRDWLVNVIDALADAIEKEKIRRAKQQTRLKRSISLRKLESILYRESGCVDPVDVPLMMKVVYEKAGVDVPQRLLDEVEESERELG